MSTYTWRGTSLIDAPVATSATPAGITVGAETLRVISDNPVDFRASGTDGSTYRVHKRGLTVARYDAHCAGRDYSVNRTGVGKRRDIVDSAGIVVARTREHVDGTLDVLVADDPSAEVMVDVAFISWALTFVDTPTRRTMI
ncbi:hypothetical protein CAPI_03490 [Corynebacterium capitovis DSM 44611]|uniref:hypothetical protein n=1 Tax=Corynebacterium capitovis TaxID=131081 RepID=UPI000370A645|nr:hypothetical protein [Corynebacterium capitovis]WKD57260.1 hypothetical protein CAPI_03490 [Corynebacterium capitovis DSM 44611]